MTLAVVILNYNGEVLLPTYLPSVLAHNTRNAVIYVIDNASTDQSLVYLESLSEQINIISLNENYGFAGGYNEGLKEVKEDIFVLLNSDVEVTPGWLTPLVDTLENNSNIGAVVPKIRSYTNRAQFEYAGASGGYLDRYGYAFCRGRMIDEIETDEGQYEDEIAVAWGSGCALVIRSNVFHQLGGFDPSFFAHFEEIDLCWRIRRAGYRIHCVPTSTIFHLGGGTLNYVSPQKLYLNFRNSLFMLYKNLFGWHCLKTLFIRLILDGAAGFVYLLKGQFQSLLAILKAHYNFYFSLAKLRNRSRLERSLINQHSVGPYQKDGEFSGSILWSYFVQKKKAFNQLTDL